MIISPYGNEGEQETDFVRRASGLLVPKKYKPYPIAFDFFAGCGGFSCGLVQAGYDVVGALEYAPDAAHTYMVNLCAHPVQIHYTSDLYKKKLTDYFQKVFDKAMKAKNPDEEIVQVMGLSGSGWIQNARDDDGLPFPAGQDFFFGDIRETTGEKLSAALGINIGELDLVVGGPPCQGYSHAGKRQIMDPRNSLVFEYARLICELQPKSFVMENVPGIVTMVTPAGVNVIDQFLRILEDGNYMSYEAGMKALGIREKELGTKVKYVVRPSKIRAKKKEEKKRPIKRPTFIQKKQIDLFA